MKQGIKETIAWLGLSASVIAGGVVGVKQAAKSAAPTASMIPLVVTNTPRIFISVPALKARGWTCDQLNSTNDYDMRAMFLDVWMTTNLAQPFHPYALLQSTNSFYVWPTNKQEFYKVRWAYHLDSATWLYSDWSKD